MDRETGFLHKYIACDAKGIGETRFLALGRDLGAIARVDSDYLLGFTLTYHSGIKYS